MEDETGIANVILCRSVFEQLHLVARHAKLLVVRGVVERQRQGSKDDRAPVVPLIVHDLEHLEVPGRDLPGMSRDFH